MLSRCRRCYFQMSGFPGGAAWTVPVWALVIVAALSLWIPPVRAMSGRQIRELREETEHMFYHGFENYMEHAFPEDELRPVSCRPLTRDRENPAHVDLNDVLGNYSLTLVDSLSTLAILSSSPPLSSGSNSDLESPRKAWGYFQDGVRDLVELYGDGSDGPAGTGSRGKGFDSDSKVQVFETVIRGLGGLLSAHLFAVGELPIRGYEPPEDEASFAKLWDKSGHTKGNPGIRWENGFVYNGQLLRLAMDLGTRILPAFYTPTGLPYPRVNLRRGVPFYTNSPFNAAAAPETAARISNDQGKQQGKTTQKPEVTETCSAGAGSLVLEFTVLSRLTGDGRFEEFAKRAFWAVWSRRSDIGLIGAGIDAESGKWVNSYTGIGAGIDSFFEYALKSHILLSEGDRPQFNLSSPFHKFDDFYAPLSEEEHSPDAFLNAWEESRASIKHHLYRGSGYQHPHYVQGDIITGATRAFWIDSLSAYFPGLLTLSGDVDGAIEAHLLHAAVWTRFSAFPERWNVATGNIENGLGWWGGRPEFIESTYYLYRATKDPWYLHVGEMALRDIKRRCWTRCGWAGLQDVRDGQLSDRMESFFLGETAKYLFLLFNPSHPLNDLDAPFVFSTEGHPLIIPKSPVKPTKKKIKLASPQNVDTQRDSGATCAVPAPLLPLGCSSIAGRPDIFHAASLARLHLMPARPEVDSPIVEYAIDHPRISMSDLISPSNYTYFPWTLPLEVIPPEATSAPMAVRPTLDLTFPPFANTIFSPGSLERVQDGVLVKSIGGLRLGMIQDVPLFTDGSSASTEGYRVQIINNFPLGKDEKVYISKEVTDALNSEDPNFTRVQDSTLLDVVLDLRSEVAPNENLSSTLTAATNSETIIGELDDFHASFDASTFDASNMKLAFASFFNQVTSLLRDDSDSTLSSFSSRKPTIRITIPATTSTGKGSTSLPDVEEALLSPSTVSKSNKGKKLVNRLPWSTIYVADELCDHRLPAVVPRTHHIIVIKRGGCSFSAKIKNIPSFRPTSDSLKLVIIVSYPQPGDRPPSSSSTSSSGTDPDTPTNSVVDTEEPYLIRPLLDEVQTVAGGIPRPNPLSVILVAGGDKTYNYFKHAVGVGLRRRYEIRSQGVPIGNLIVI